MLTIIEDRRLEIPCPFWLTLGLIKSQLNNSYSFIRLCPWEHVSYCNLHVFVARRAHKGFSYSVASKPPMIEACNELNYAIPFEHWWEQCLEIRQCRREKAPSVFRLSNKHVTLMILIKNTNLITEAWLLMILYTWMFDVISR